MSRNALFAFASLAILVYAAEVLAQTDKTYQDKSNGFSISLLSDWTAVTYSDAVGRRKTDFIYRDRSEGLLRISKDSLGSRSVAEMVRGEEDGVSSYRQAYERGTQESFGGGALHGVLLTYNYVEGGRKMAETDYFLQDGDQVWELRFTGKRGVLDLIRNVTDEMARSFHPLPRG
ncbi:MAG TPA: hypothetical protein VJX67_24405 [Blastocatellia bacterium]|nr:hypothetical protein [Blastocatellia bacterium]